MQLKDLEAMGGVLSDAPVEKEIKFKLDDDTEHAATIFVKRLGLGEYERLMTGESVEWGTSARIISEAISLGEKGKEKIPVQKAFRLHKGLAQAMLEAFKEVNGGKKG